MSLKKKVVWLPYDMDTAIGINNEGALTFSYNLEDTDQVDGEDVYNGQQSVFWNNLRKTYYTELKAMYQSLRSKQDTDWDYDEIERRFEEHQSKWPEAIFNEDAWFKYLQPLVDDGDENYLGMLQGSKEEQRKWWLYNRFRYLDSKYNAGDALTDKIVVRGYAKSNITVTPYADIYASIKFGSYLLQQRATRNQSYTFVCPLDNVNDTETEIYSASQLASVGDLSGYQVGYADFHLATKLQNIKLGDSSSSYSNPHLYTLSLGNNTLLQTIDCRNCTGLGSEKSVTKAPDLSGCTGLEYAYFDGTQITGVTFANGGILKVVHLPSTVLSLQIFNQPKLTDLTIPSYTQLRSVALVNVGTAIDEISLINSLSNGTNVRFVGFSWQLDNVAALSALKAKLDMLGGLDESGNNAMDMAQLQGNIYIPTLTGAAVAEFQASYPSVTFSYDHITAELKYYSWDGQTLLHTETVTDGGNGTYTGTPTRTQTAQYTFAFSGWSTEMDSGTADANALKNVESDRNVYAAYTKTVRTYTVRFMNGTTVLQTVNNVPYGGTATYTGTTPVHSDPDNYEFNGWDPSPVGITGATDCQPTWNWIGSITRTLIKREITEISNSTITVIGASAFAHCLSLTNVNLPAVTTLSSSAFGYCKRLSSISLPAVTFIGIGAFAYCNSNLTSVYLPSVSSISAQAFVGCTKLTNIDMPSLQTVGVSAFATCHSLTDVNLPAAITISDSAFASCSSLVSINLPAAKTLGSRIFYSCLSLVDVNLPSATVLNNGVFENCYSLEQISVPKVTRIGQSAFRTCSALTKLSLPKVSYMDKGVFDYCTSLSQLYLLSTSVCSIPQNIFGLTPFSKSSYLGYFGSFYVPSSLVSAYKSATFWTLYADRITAYTGD